MTQRSINEQFIPSPTIDKQVDALLSQMTLAEKVGQMAQVEKHSITPDQVSELAIGSVLSGGGGNPTPNNPESWASMVRAFQEGALQSRLGIPILYGTDGVHGHSNVVGATIFPHNIGLGAADDPELVEKIGYLTGSEILATGSHWTFAPSVAVPQDIRWGRVYEGYSEDTALVTKLGRAFIRGLQKTRPDNLRAMGSAKHFVADGGTTWGTTQYISWLSPTNWQAATPNFKIDQGDAQFDEATLRAVHLRPYLDAIDEGVFSVMISFSSWNGDKIHGHRYLITDVLKGELGFEGFVISDWMAINQLDPEFYNCVVQAINAGLDMIMVPYDHQQFLTTLTQAIQNEDISQERIDDAVRRILRVKYHIGLFEHPHGDESLLADVGSREHRNLAREAVSKSLVLLKNEGDVLPLSKESREIVLIGRAANNIGLQCGGWSIDWQGRSGPLTDGTTIFEGIQQVISPATQLIAKQEAKFSDDEHYAVGIVVLAEEPYAEGVGDKADVILSADDIATLENTRQHCEKVVVILMSGRPMVITDQLPLMDAFVAAWLPGTEGRGIADVLFGDQPFSGKLTFSWPRDLTQLPLTALKASADGPLWPFGYGLTT
jgi:beta-glucosidase